MIFSSLKITSIKLGFKTEKRKHFINEFWDLFINYDLIYSQVNLYSICAEQTNWRFRFINRTTSNQWKQDDLVPSNPDTSTNQPCISM